MRKMTVDEAVVAIRGDDLEECLAARAVLLKQAPIYASHEVFVRDTLIDLCLATSRSLHETRKLKRCM